MTLDADIGPTELEILRTRLEGVAEEIGTVLIRGAYSPNIKERRDCSAALFDGDGRLIAQAEHIPVHLGAMPAAVEAVLDANPAPGETYILNDPYAGGSHLPDVTIVTPIAIDDTIEGYAATRAHHADVGGKAPGSMPADGTEIYQEGLRLPPTRIAVDGAFDESLLAVLLANVRTPAERRADLRAQLGATERGVERFVALADEYGLDRLRSGIDAVIDYSRRRQVAEIESIPDGTYRAADVLEGDGQSDNEILLQATVTVDDNQLHVDFDGTADQVPGNMNAPRAVAVSATYFVVRAVTDPDIPPNHGCYEPISVSVPDESVLNPTPPAAVVGGNVETSQRVTDVLLDAFAEAMPGEVPAGSQGTMNNLLIGGSGEGGFTYYETIGGGFGARPDRDGIDGVQVGMTNTMNTPVEAIEREYPLLVERYCLRPDSGGDGEYRGGTGIERSIRLLTDATVSLLTERRQTAPAGRNGGAPGTTGENRFDGESVGAKITRLLTAGSVVTVRTPGGGGYGDPSDREETARNADRLDGLVSLEDGGDKSDSSE